MHTEQEITEGTELKFIPLSVPSVTSCSKFFFRFFLVLSVSLWLVCFDL